jgi:hypothetical protein
MKAKMLVSIQTAGTFDKLMPGDIVHRIQKATNLPPRKDGKQQYFARRLGVGFLLLEGEFEVIK